MMHLPRVTRDGEGWHHCPNIYEMAAREAQLYERLLSDLNQHEYGEDIGWAGGGWPIATLLLPMNQTPATIAVVAATIGTITFLVPQAVKLIRTRDTEGVSATWPALGFVVNLGWFVYMIGRELWVATLAPFATFLSYLVVLWALRRAGRELTAGGLRAAAWGVFLAATGVIGGWATFGVALGLSVAVQLSPPVWTAYRSANPSGVSAGTWWIGLAEAILWGYYGLFHNDAGIITFGVVAAAVSILMLARYYVTRERVAVLAASADM